MEIKFTNVWGVSEEYAPKPSSAVIPEWYKDLESYVGGKKVPDGAAGTTATAKRCMPIFDMVTAGYIIFSSADLYVETRDDQPYYQWSGNNLIEFHPTVQAPNHPARNGLESYPKWMNPWGITTPKGYSTLFIQPTHREAPFTILPGVVDTDRYVAPINFPFVLNDPKFTGYIPAGTPIAQAIPFKRDDWNMSFGSQKDIDAVNQVTTRMRSKFFDRYKSMFRAIKEYK